MQIDVRFRDISNSITVNSVLLLIIINAFVRCAHDRELKINKEEEEEVGEARKNDDRYTYFEFISLPICSFCREFINKNKRKKKLKKKE